jgi:hypothetical protein
VINAEHKHPVLESGHIGTKHLPLALHVRLHVSFIIIILFFVLFYNIKSGEMKVKKYGGNALDEERKVRNYFKPIILLCFNNVADNRRPSIVKRWVS